jgi:hypothetical protein
MWLGAVVASGEVFASQVTVRFGLLSCSVGENRVLSVTGIVRGSWRGLQRTEPTEFSLPD